MQQSSYQVQQGATYWFTGFSGAGKSTLSEALKARLDKEIGDKTAVFILDGDVIRTGLNKGLGFSPEDRAENIRRIAEVSKLFNMAGKIVFVAFISPYKEGRLMAKELHAASGLPFVETHISASLDCCEARDVKGLYKKARSGVIPKFTGISDPYEAPENPELAVNTGELSLDQAQQVVINDMVSRGILSKTTTSRVVDCLIQPVEAEEESVAFKALPRVDIDEHQVQYLQTIGDGWAYPLKRFMNEMELLESMQMKTITDEAGKQHLLSVPITMHLTEAKKLELEAAGGDFGIWYKDELYAVMKEPVFFPNRKEEICARVFGCFDPMHSGAQPIMAQGEWLVSGSSMRFTKRVTFDDGMDKYRYLPSEIADQIKAKGADAVYAFQVRNPLHNGHCLLLNDTRQQLIKQGYKNPILLLHPLGGWCKDDDVPLKERMDQHQALFDDGTINPEHAILAVWPSPMYYGGPTEVLWHASSRVNCAISHFITGRDPAGVKHPNGKEDCYDAWHGQKLLVHMKQMLNGVEVLPFKVAAYNKVNQQMEFFGGPGCNKDDFEFISGSRMRAMAKSGETPPKGFMSENGWKVLAAYYQSLD